MCCPRVSAEPRANGTLVGWEGGQPQWVRLAEGGGGPGATGYFSSAAWRRRANRLVKLSTGRMP
jgi:hypothetical protein